MLSAPILTAQDVTRLLDLKPHPEGGHFRETFRDPRTLEGGWSASTAIYFLLARCERSHWHRVDAVEAWHWYAGAALQLRISESGDTQTLALGPDLAAGERLAEDVVENTDAACAHGAPPERRRAMWRSAPSALFRAERIFFSVEGQSARLA